MEDPIRKLFDDVSRRAEVASYWRFNGASEIVEKSLEETEEYLETLATLVPQRETLRASLLQRCPDWDGGFLNCPHEWASDEAEAMHRAIWRAEDRLRSATRTASLMATIHLEAVLNMLVFERFGEGLTESIERLTLVGKIEVAHGLLGRPPFRGSAPYAAAKALYQWRSAFAHGKNPDRRTQTLKENHLTHRRINATSQVVVDDMLTQVERYVTVMDHLATLSADADDVMFDEQEVKRRIQAIRRYRFGADGTVAGVSR